MASATATATTPQFANGTRLNMGAPSGRIYLVLDGKPCHVPDMDTYTQLFKDSKWTSITTRPVAGPAITHLAYLARLQGKPEVFLISNEIKRHVISMPVFDAYGFDATKLKTISQSDFDALDRGADIGA